jgi:hypothetical protein
MGSTQKGTTMVMHKSWRFSGDLSRVELERLESALSRGFDRLEKQIEMVGIPPEIPVFEMASSGFDDIFRKESHLFCGGNIDEEIDNEYLYIVQSFIDYEEAGSLYENYMKGRFFSDRDEMAGQFFAALQTLPTLTEIFLPDWSIPEYAPRWQKAGLPTTLCPAIYLRKSPMVNPNLQIPSLSKAFGALNNSLAAERTYNLYLAAAKAGIYYTLDRRVCLPTSPLLSGVSWYMLYGFIALYAMNPSDFGFVIKKLTTIEYRSLPVWILRQIWNEGISLSHLQGNIPRILAEMPIRSLFHPHPVNDIDLFRQIIEQCQTISLDYE